MMIYIFTQRDPFFTDTFLEEFDKYNIPYNVFDFPNFNKGLIFGVKRAILLYGFYGFLKMLYIYANIKFKRKFSNMIDNRKVKSSEEMASILSQIDEEDVLFVCKRFKENCEGRNYDFLFSVCQEGHCVTFCNIISLKLSK